MKRLGLWAIGVAALALAGPIATHAGENEGRCTLTTLNGQYLFNGTGTLFSPAFGLPSGTTAIGTSAGFHIFNGDGTGIDFVAFSINGTVVVPSSSTPITYTLKPDCTGTYQVPGTPTLHFDIFVAVDGSALTVIETDPGVALSWGPQPRASSGSNAQ